MTLHLRTLRLLLIFAAFFAFTLSFSQNTFIKTYGQIGWFNTFGTVNINKKTGLHVEYQWRRSNYIKDWQQSLLRVGYNYQMHPSILLRAGYAWIETFAYGTIPINVFGKDFTEHRLFEMAQFSHQAGHLAFTHRLMLEQRFVGRYSQSNLIKEDQFPLLHRARYMMRLQVPLGTDKTKNKTPYVALFDEVFIGFGKHVIYNVFDQNRIGVMIGYKYNQALRFEAGYLNQTIQFGRQINKQSILQFNSGFIINIYIWMDFSKKST